MPKELNDFSKLSPLYGILFLDGVGAGILMPVLPFVAMEFRVSALAVTGLVAVFAGFSAIGGLTLGRLSDHFSKRMVLTVALTIMAISYVGMCLATNYTFILGMRAISGFAAGNTAVVQGIISSATTNDQRPAMLGRAGAATAAGFLAGPVFVALSVFHPPHVSTTKFAFYLALAFAALALALGIFDLLTRSERSRDGALEQEGEQVATGGFSLTKARGPLTVIFVFLLGTMAFAAPLSISALWSNVQFHWGTAAVGGLIALATASLAVTQLLAFPLLVKTLGGGKTFALGPLLIGLGLTVCPLAHLQASFWIGHVIAAAGFGILSASSPTLIANLVAANSRGAWLGASEAARAVGQCIGPLTAGWAYQAISPDASYYQAALITALGFGVAIALSMQRGQARSDGELAAESTL